MPIFPWSARGDVPPVGDPAFDALLARNPLPDDSARGLRPVAELIAALTAAPATSELAAEATALARFRGAVGISDQPTRSRHRRHPVLSTKLAAAAAAAAVTLGGVAAAYAGVLPSPVQKLAHDTIGAPSARAGAHPAAPVGPDATGPAAFGLCTAWAHLKAHGSAKQKAVAFRNLAAAAGGAANVTAYCARVTHPGAAPSGNPTSHPTGKPTSHPTGKPTSHPTGKPTCHPTGKPTSHPTGKPTSHPTGKPTTCVPIGKPTSHPHPTGKPTGTR